MTQNSGLKQHVYLFDLMADRLGKDLEIAVLDDKTTPTEIVDAAVRCSGCSQAADCAARLPKETPDQLPFDYCRNADLFTKL